jgi:hypothetical protein
MLLTIMILVLIVLPRLAVRVLVFSERPALLDAQTRQRITRRY